MLFFYERWFEGKDNKPIIVFGTNFKAKKNASK